MISKTPAYVFACRYACELTGMPATERDDVDDVMLADRKYIRRCRVLGLSTHFGLPNSDLVRQTRIIPLMSALQKPLKGIVVPWLSASPFSIGL